MEGVDYGQAGVGGECPRDFRGLIEMAVPQPLAVQRHGHQRPAALQRGCQARIGEGLAGESPELTDEMDFTAVFQTVDQIERALVPRHRRSCELEGKLEVAAIRAGKWAADVSRKHLAARFAKRLGQARQVRATRRAE